MTENETFLDGAAYGLGMAMREVDNVLSLPPEMRQQLKDAMKRRIGDLNKEAAAL